MRGGHMSCICVESGMVACATTGILLCIKSFSTMDKHTDIAVYLKHDGKMPCIHDAMDAHNNLAACLVESTKL